MRQLRGLRAHLGAPIPMGSAFWGQRFAASRNFSPDEARIQSPEQGRFHKRWDRSIYRTRCVPDPVSLLRVGAVNWPGGEVLCEGPSAVPSAHVWPAAFTQGLRHCKVRQTAWLVSCVVPQMLGPGTMA